MRMNSVFFPVLTVQRFNGLTIQRAQFEFVSNFELRISNFSISRPALRYLNQFDFVAFRRVNKGDTSAVRFEMRAIGIFEAVTGQVFAEFFEAIHLEGQMCQIGLDLHWAAGWEIAKLDEFLAGGCFHENQFGTAGRLVTPRFFQAEHVSVEFYGFFEVIDSIARMKKFCSLAHAPTIAWNWTMTTRIEQWRAYPVRPV